MKSLILAALFITSSLQAVAGHTLDASQQQFVHTWLQRHTVFRAATDADCRCDSELRMMREGDGGIWKPVHDYHPYVVTGDFNGDGVTDFAVAVVNTSRAVRKFTLLVFNGPLRSSRANPAFVESNVDMTSTGFFYGPPRPKPYRLVIGKFESEGTALVPHGKTYRYEEISSVEE